jgi:hypothetical protein
MQHAVLLKHVLLILSAIIVLAIAGCWTWFSGLVFAYRSGGSRGCGEPLFRVALTEVKNERRQSAKALEALSLWLKTWWKDYLYTVRNPTSPEDETDEEWDARQW